MTYQGRAFCLIYMACPDSGVPLVGLQHWMGSALWKKSGTKLSKISHLPTLGNGLRLYFFITGTRHIEVLLQPNSSLLQYKE